MNSIEDKIPKTGRIGRFAKIVKKEVPIELFLRFLLEKILFLVLLLFLVCLALPL